MSAIMVPLETARELAHGRPHDTVDNYVVVANKYVDSGRWTNIYLLIIEQSNGYGFFGAHYELGATEYQDIRPFEDESGDIKFVNYAPRVITTVEWDKRDG